MPNNYFQFKQFTVQQQNCAMKVCTDACLFGAYVADVINKKNIAINNMLDIGTGTGLLSLLLAQKTNANIDAVEIDQSAYQQAAGNFSESPWKERLHLFNEDIITFSSNKKYDCIISNPPFFEGDLKSSHQNKNAAKHDTTLTLQQLFATVKKLLAGNGFFAVLLPHHRVTHCIEVAQKTGLFLSEKVLVKQSVNHPYFRGILLFSNKVTNYEASEITIKNETGNYSPEFAALLKDYYLYLS